MNPKGGTPPEESRFSSDKQPSNPGRTPTKWIRDFLTAACDKSPEGKSRRQRTAEVAYWTALRCNPETGQFDPSIPVKDANAARELIWAYDMGQPPKPLELSGPDGVPLTTPLLKVSFLDAPPELAGGDVTTPIETPPSPAKDG